MCVEEPSLVAAPRRLVPLRSLARVLPLSPLLLLIWVAGATAAPITYEFTSGSATLSVEQGGVEIGAATGLLTGTSLTFDAASLEVVDFEFSLGETSITLAPALGGIENLVIESAVFTPGAGYATLSGSDLGGGAYFVVAGPVDVDGSWRSEAPGAINPSTSFSTTNPFLSADLSVAGGSLSALGITLGVLDLGGEQVTVKADLAFEGLQPGIPEPSAAVLMAAGAAFQRRIRPRRGRRNRRSQDRQGRSTGRPHLRRKCPGFRPLTSGTGIA
jgi:hypothetical protein